MYHRLFHVCCLMFLFSSFLTFYSFFSSLVSVLLFLLQGILSQFTCIIQDLHIMWNREILAFHHQKLLWYINPLSWCTCYLQQVRMWCYSAIKVLLETESYSGVIRTWLWIIFPVYSETGGRELLWDCNQQERMLCAAAMCWIFWGRSQRSTVGWDNRKRTTPGRRSLWVCFTKPHQCFTLYFICECNINFIWFF